MARSRRRKAKKRGRKHPKTEYSPRINDGKHPITQEHPDAYPFCWDLKKIDLGFKWSFANAKITDFIEVINRLKDFESMKWGDLPKTKSHAIQITDIDKRAQERVQELGLEIDEVYSIRINGKQRVFGYREMKICYILWWDPEHEICPSRKKYT